MGMGLVLGLLTCTLKWKNAITVRSFDTHDFYCIAGFHKVSPKESTEHGFVSVCVTDFAV